MPAPFEDDDPLGDDDPLEDDDPFEDAELLLVDAPLDDPFPFEAPEAFDPLWPGALALLPRSWDGGADGRPPFAAVAGRATEVSAMAALTVQMTAIAGADRRFTLL